MQARQSGRRRPPTKSLFLVVHCNSSPLPEGRPHSTYRERQSRLFSAGPEWLCFVTSQPARARTRWEILEGATRRERVTFWFWLHAVIAGKLMELVTTRARAKQKGPARTAIYVTHLLIYQVYCCCCCCCCCFFLPAASSYAYQIEYLKSLSSSHLG